MQCRTTINVTETIVSMQDGITHNSNSDKGSVYFDWTAPDAGSGALSFGYNTMSCYRQACSFDSYSLSATSKFRRLVKCYNIIIVSHAHALCMYHNKFSLMYTV